MPAPKLSPAQIAELQAMRGRCPHGYPSAKARAWGVSRNSVWQIINGHRHAEKPAHPHRDALGHLLPGHPVRRPARPKVPKIDRVSYAQRIFAKISAAA